MKRKVKFVTYGHSSPDDPTGSGNDAPSEEIDAFILDDGRLQLAPNYFTTAIEGTNPGQYHSVSDVTNANLSALKSAITTLAGDSDPDIAMAATAIVAKLSQQDRPTVVQQLLAVAQNGTAPTTRRAMAILLIGMIVEDVV